MTDLPNIAFTGKMGAGKTTAAELLTELGYERLSFAAPLKSVARQLWGGDGAKREYLQKLGVAVREIDRDTWVDLLLADAELLNDPPYVVDDLRFPNEFYGLLGAGFTIIRVVAPLDQRIARLTANGRWTGHEAFEHESETALDHLTPDYIIDNDAGREELAAQLLPIIERERR